MKNVIYGGVLFLICVLAVFNVLSLHGRNSRTTEMYDSLSSAVEQSLDNVMTKSDYSIKDKEQFVSDFTESLLYQIDSESKITVNVIKADTEKGLLSMEIVEEFAYPNGKVGSVTYQKTAIFDQKDNPKGKKEEHENHEVVLYVKPTPDAEYQEYRKYTLSNKEILTIEELPGMENATLLYWTDANGNKVESADGICPTEDMKLYAVMEYSNAQEESLSVEDENKIAE